MLQMLLEYLFPRSSLTGVAGAWVTDAELAAMQSTPIILDQALLRRRGIMWLDRVVAASSYRHAPLLHTAVHRFKYGRIPAVGRVLAQLLLPTVPLLPSADSTVLCPVPLHWMRTFWRGFNQAEILAEPLIEQCQYRSTHALQRIRSTGVQAKRSRTERLTAMQGAFSCALLPPGTTVLLIDDVCTTGSTLNACAEALKQAGATRVEGLVLAAGE